METSTIPPKKPKPPYLIGLLCLIPLVGAFVGLALLLYGLIKYKDKWLSIIGAAGIIWTIVFYSLIFYASTHLSPFKKGFENIAQMQLNSLVKNIEFYKLQHGQYPDNLKQVSDDDKLAPVIDVAQGLNAKEGGYYNYEKRGSKYSLFSSGQDGIPDTKDDLFPQIIITDSSKIGLVKHFANLH
ncbi:type II secretion system protein GspG [Ferruginibacter albus]|uniref:type II secretion system protein GspG n=1 Tax=Ferruginibacter albus TaxID=2875540 RepID=UPI001CC488CF|nr:type II secretion system protein GspG [Ferruginibacter albus]UAY51198.1 type II secretion system protein GspG [Ferruginibacter albus]